MQGRHSRTAGWNGSAEQVRSGWGSTKLASDTIGQDRAEAGQGRAEVAGQYRARQGSTGQGSKRETWGGSLQLGISGMGWNPIQRLQAYASTTHMHLD